VKIAVLNSGSSSLKFKLFRGIELKEVVSATVEEIGRDSRVKFAKNSKRVAIRDHLEALKFLESWLREDKILESFRELDAVGHRVVHGGDSFDSAVVVDDEVKAKIRANFSLAPLHNPPNLAGIETLEKIAPDLKQVALFDTAFHQSLKSSSRHYALPKEWFENYGVKRYGFHGISCSYLLQESAKILKKEPKECNLIIAHLGNGASVTAVKSGKSIDTSMGLTPLEGLVMGSRCGDIDPSIVFYIQRELGVDFEEIERILNQESGLVGLCKNSDMREIIRKKAQGSEDAKLAFEIFVERIAKYIGAYLTHFENLDAIIFSGGIGANSPEVQRAVLEKLAIFGINANEVENSQIKILVLPTNEELFIAQESLKFC
jgi:acetate kinase